MAGRNLSRMHADYLLTAPSRKKSRDLFNGDEVVKSLRTEYLPQEKNETALEYDLRLKRACLDPWVERIISARQAVLFMKDPVRIVPPSIFDAPWKDDIDRQGSSSNGFFQEVCKNSQIDGICWVLVDMTRVPAGGFETKLEEEQASHRPFLRMVPADNVVDWATGPDGRLLFVVIESSTGDTRSAEDYGMEPESRKRFEIWTRKAWMVFEEEKAQDYTLVDGGDHPVGEVPIVPFFGVRNTGQSGWPVCRSVLQHILLIYMKESDKDWFERLSCHPIPWVVGVRQPAVIDAGKGLFLKTEAGEPAPSVGYLETSGAPSSVVAASIARLEFKILSIALAQATKETAQVQAADTIREDRRVFDATIRTCSNLYETAEATCWKFLCRWMGADEESVDISYFKDFDARQMEAAMVSILSSLVPAGNLTLQTFLEVIKRGGVLPDWVNIEEEMGMLAEQNDLENQTQTEEEYAAEMDQGISEEANTVGQEV